MGRPDPWDVIVVGGGITGAGVAREAARRGKSVLLVEQRDFAWGTSSRSSKMVHGGLRYIAQGDIKLTRDALRERERLLTEAPTLVRRMGYWWGHRKGQFPGRIAFGILLKIYDGLAGIRDHHFVSRDEYLRRVPGHEPKNLLGATYYTDSTVDDARLVLRVLDEAIGDGAVALNYVRVTSLIKADGRVRGVALEDVVTGKPFEARAKVVINATGAWADGLRREMVNEKKVRPLRGSHIVFPRERLPHQDVVAFLHVTDKRPVFIFPWEGTTVVGTTDLDHTAPLHDEPRITREELHYLLSGVQGQFPEADLDADDILSTWAGVRPVVASGKGIDPSKERRDHVVWDDSGLVSVTGGKLTTFRLIALDALAKAAKYVPGLDATDEGAPTFRKTVSTLDGVPKAIADRIIGRYGFLAQRFVSEMPREELVPIGDTETLVADLRWAARNEAVVRIEDLLLRRTRLGNILRDGGSAHAALIKATVQAELGLSDDAYEKAWNDYLALVRSSYALPT